MISKHINVYRNFLAMSISSRRYVISVFNDLMIKVHHVSVRLQATVHCEAYLTNTRCSFSKIQRTMDMYNNPLQSMWFPRARSCITIVIAYKKTSHQRGFWVQRIHVGLVYLFTIIYIDRPLQNKQLQITPVCAIATYSDIWFF